MNHKKTKLFLLGATGSIGFFSQKALNLVDASLYGITFYNNYSLAKEILLKHPIRYVFSPSLQVQAQLKKDFPHLHIFSSKEELASFFKEDIQDFTIINGISGPAGLWYTYQSLLSGRKILLANKESVILGGQWLLKQKQYETQIIPIDSEHFSLFILLSHFPKSWVKSLGITASGGPFLHLPIKDFKSITVSQALKHPVWNMGNNISLGSATLANKGLELLEAKELFCTDINDIHVRIHPQAHTHAMVFFHNNTWVSHQYFPSMETPIAQAIIYPDLPTLQEDNKEPLIQIQDYSLPDFEKFPMLKLAYEVGKNHHIYQMVYTLANDFGNSLFLQEKISFTQIYDFVKFNLDRIQTVAIDSIFDVLSLTDILSVQITENWRKFL